MAGYYGYHHPIHGWVDNFMSIKEASRRAEATPLAEEQIQDILQDCVTKGGPVQVYLTVAGIKVCGRCGHTNNLHIKV